MNAPGPSDSASGQPSVNGHELFDKQMAQGQASHAAGDRVAALSAFESALALHPGHPRAASACATLLFELARPKAALACLLTVEDQLLADAEGAANLAFAASACGDLAMAARCFLAALGKDAGHVRALSHLGLMRAQQGRWDEAIALGRRCLAQAVHEDWAWTALADFLLGARRNDEALQHLEEARRHFPDHAAFAMRQAVALAVAGRFDASDTLLASLAAAAPAGHGLAGDARTLFCRHAFEALSDCDWRNQGLLQDVLEKILAGHRAGAAPQDLRTAMVLGAMVPLNEADTLQAAASTWQALSATPPTTGRPFTPSDVLNRQGRIRVGIAAHSLRDQAATTRLAAQLALHDSSRFDIRVYSPTPQPQAVLAQALVPWPVVEIAHFSDAEAAARIRLDRLDLWVDLTFGSPWWRPALTAWRVAPVQLLHPGASRQPASSPVDYTVSDVHVHPDGGMGGNTLVRLPHTCWPAAGIAPSTQKTTFTRAQACLPADALVLCNPAPAVQIDSHSFSLWMRLLHALPEAVLWLPAVGLAAQRNLQREAAAAGIDAMRLCFAAPGAHGADGAIGLADIFLDTLRISAGHELQQALVAGVPAVSCAGHRSESRAGASILAAARMGDCVAQGEKAYVDKVLGLARDPDALRQLREGVQNQLAGSPLLDLPARVRELEIAWITLAERARAGLRPRPFDVPPVNPTVGKALQSLPHQ
ncbi:MAG: tetratricopeptide repeat protein [Polaromonas sp.]|nr:tetratricopeptide repeat protein [Polaromonas sp.]